MRTFNLKYSLGLLRPVIDSDYFMVVGALYKALVYNLAVYSLTVKPIVDTTIIDQPSYQPWFITMATTPMIPVIPRLLIPEAVILDMELYLSAFITDRHNRAMLNIYGLSIDDVYNIHITNKQIRIANAAQNDPGRVTRAATTSIMFQ